jgi:hypothetical protein
MLRFEGSAIFVIDLAIFKRRLIWNVSDLGERNWLDGIWPRLSQRG